MLAKLAAEVFVPGTPGHAGQAATELCPPPPLPPGPPPGGGGNSGGGGCQPGTGRCCTIYWMPDRHGDLVPVLVCV